MTTMLSSLFGSDTHPHPAIQSHLTPPGPKITTDTGLKLSATENSLTAGVRGPTILNDFSLIEKVRKFDHERIPERVVHARGAGAWGKFQLHTPIPEFSRAKVLTEKEEVPVFVRFSTVGGSRGSADTVRDVRGFAVRFYTKEGNWDIVGNNIPVFFIQDGAKFPDLIHAAKPAPHNEIPQAQTAHDNFWDWSSLSPETAHMMMWQLSDYTIPRSFRTMRGFGVNTFILQNDKNEMHFVKFHWKPKAGSHSLVWDEALKINGQDPDFHRRDLYEAIEKGSYPVWELGVQILPASREHEFSFDILDATKLWPENIIPVKYIGELTLNRNPSDYFAETEQVGFCTTHVVLLLLRSDPVFGHSNCPLLALRNFSYPDTQLIRLGGPNWNEIPINRPVCPVMNHHRDGFSRQKVQTARANYHPNRFGPPEVSTAAEGGYTECPQPVSGVIGRTKGEKWSNHYEQATLFWNSVTEIEREHIVAAATFEFSRCEDVEIHKAMLDRLNEVHNDFACRVAANLGLKAPAAKKYHSDTADGLSMLKGCSAEALGTLNAVQGRKVGIVIVDGVNSASVKLIQAELELAGVIPLLVGPRKGSVKASEGVELQSDFTLSNSRSTLYDSLILPPHEPASYTTLAKDGHAIHFFMEAYKHQKGLLIYGSGGQDFLTRVCHLPLSGSTGTSAVVDGVVYKPEFEERAGVTEWTKLEGGNEIVLFVGVMMGHRAWTRDVESVPA